MSKPTSSPFFAPRYRRLYANRQAKNREFPYDVPYMPASSLYEMQKHAHRYQLPAWSNDRIQAHVQDDDLVKKRASVTAFLWTKYEWYAQHRRPLTVELLQKWIEIERLEEVLQDMNTHAPAHLRREAKAHGMSPQAWWDQVLAAQGITKHDVQQRHFALLHEVGQGFRQD